MDWGALLTAVIAFPSLSSSPDSHQLKTFTVCSGRVCRLMGATCQPGVYATVVDACSHPPSDPSPPVRVGVAAEVIPASRPRSLRRLAPVAAGCSSPIALYSMGPAHSTTAAPTSTAPAGTPTAVDRGPPARPVGAPYVPAGWTVYSPRSRPARQRHRRRSPPRTDPEVRGIPRAGQRPRRTRCRPGRRRSSWTVATQAALRRRVPAGLSRSSGRRCPAGQAAAGRGLLSTGDLHDRGPQLIRQRRRRPQPRCSMS